MTAAPVAESTTWPLTSTRHASRVRSTDPGGRPTGPQAKNPASVETAPWTAAITAMAAGMVTPGPASRADITNAISGAARTLPDPRPAPGGSTIGSVSQACSPAPASPALTPMIRSLMSPQPPQALSPAASRSSASCSAMSMIMSSWPPT